MQRLVIFKPIMAHIELTESTPKITQDYIDDIERHCNAPVINLNDKYGPSLAPLALTGKFYETRQLILELVKCLEVDPQYFFATMHPVADDLIIDD